MLSSAALLIALSSLHAVLGIPFSTPSNATSGLYSAFVSISIELVGFPAYAGSRSSPNQYSVNMVKTLGTFQNAMPVIRVGGNSQDRAIYDASYTGTAAATSCPSDSSAKTCIGPKFFDSYNSFPDTKYTFGFNQARNDASGANTLQKVVGLACKAIGVDNLEVFEFGNEPDLFSNNGYRSSSYNEANYVAEWKNNTGIIRGLLQSACPEFISQDVYGYMGPSLSSPGSKLKPSTIFNSNGYNSAGTVKQVSIHNYMGNSADSSVTVENTLMNHAKVKSSIGNHVNARNSINEDLDYVIGEHNSLYGGGAAGKSDTFGAALWAMDFSLYAATQGIKRVHFHFANGSPYSFWQPSGPNTLPSYYGALAAARLLGDSSKVSVVEIPQSVSTDVMYAAYENGKLARLAIINNKYYTSGTRGSKTYTVPVDGAGTLNLKSEILMGEAADTKNAVSFGGVQYRFADQGLPSSGGPAVQTWTASGQIQVSVQDSTAVVITVA
ncbi:glycoside hydrolase family 79 protein [Atractiella rhizophila]|nr:glycoside hydrolase family 79 protein [Atractiella rhizophila]